MSPFNAASPVQADDPGVCIRTSSCAKHAKPVSTFLLYYSISCNTHSHTAFLHWENHSQFMQDTFADLFLLYKLIIIVIYSFIIDIVGEKSCQVLLGPSGTPLMYPCGPLDPRTTGLVSSYFIQFKKGYSYPCRSWSKSCYCQVIIEYKNRIGEYRT